MALSPLQQYQYDVTHNGYNQDLAQLAAVERLQQCYEQLTRPAEQSSFWRGIFNKSEPQKIRSLYLWGGVGRGKTYLVDSFFEALPIEDKLRLHYHRLMQQVHEQLQSLAGSADPMKTVAKRFAERAKVLCIDEFFVADITDAMLMAELLKGLFQHQVVLIATSNIMPHELYRNGLQRTRFLPAIELLKEHCDIMNVDSGVDYRLRLLTAAPCFYSPNDTVNDQALITRFHQLAPEPGKPDRHLEVKNRELTCRWLADDVVLFGFSELCQSARSQLDYIELAQCFHTLLLSDVIQMTDEQTDAARRFIALVDELYDRRVKLLLSAEVSIERLYMGQRLEFEFKRCLSRLQEMQTEEYLAKPHRA